MAPEIPEWSRNASTLVFAIRSILSYIRIPSGGTERERGWNVSPEPETEMVDQPFAASEMGESMDADLLPELSGETSALIEEFTADLLLAGVMWTLLQHAAKMRRWRRYGSGFSLNPLRHGRSVLGSLRSYAVGGCKWAICPSTRMTGYGGAGWGGEGLATGGPPE